MEGNKKILIVEDEGVFARMVKMRLESVGYQVTIAEDIQSGTQYLIDGNFDLIVLDLMMPGGGGFKLLDEISGFPEQSKIPVVILTGKTITDEVKELANSYGVAHTFRKPYESHQFIDTINALLSVEC